MKTLVEGGPPAVSTMLAATSSPTALHRAKEAHAVRRSQLGLVMARTLEGRAITRPNGIARFLPGHRSRRGHFAASRGYANRVNEAFSMGRRRRGSRHRRLNVGQSRLQCRLLGAVE
jgi:hypothetical protein